jgi:hypothetical protein
VGKDWIPGTLATDAMVQVGKWAGFANRGGPRSHPRVLVPSHWLWGVQRCDQDRAGKTLQDYKLPRNNAAPGPQFSASGLPLKNRAKSW